MTEVQIWYGGRNAGCFGNIDVLPRIGEHLSTDDQEFKVTAIIHYFPSGSALNKPHIRLYVKAVK